MDEYVEAESLSVFEDWRFLYLDTVQGFGLHFPQSQENIQQFGL